MWHSVLIYEIRDIRGQKLVHALQGMIEVQRRFVFHAFVTLGCERRPRQMNRHVLILNPAATVRCERYQVIEGKTSEISRDQARQLLADIDVTRPVRIRDKAIIATLIYTAARAAAVASLRVRDLVWDGTQYSLRFAEKGGSSRSIPVRHDLQVKLLEYLTCLGKSPSKDSPFVLLRLRPHRRLHPKHRHLPPDATQARRFQPADSSFAPFMPSCHRN